MNKKKYLYRIFATFIIISLIITVFPVQGAAASDKKSAYQKTESVYSRLAATGEIKNAYVVNSFEITKPQTIEDYGKYSEVKNMTDLGDLSFSDGKVTIKDKEKVFYYQGTIKNAQLPWDFSISYRLDGKTVKPADLAGKSGKVRINFTVKDNPDVNKVFFKNYVMQISLTLDSALCRNITAKKGSIVDAGAGRQITFTLLPEKSDSFEITCDAEKFEMPGFSIAAVPYSMSIDTDDMGTGDITGQFSELSDAISELNNGTDELSEALKKIDTAGGSLEKGSAGIKSGLDALSDNSTKIKKASKKIAGSLKTISSQLNSADFSAMDDLAKLPDALTKLADALTSLHSGFNTAYQGLDTLIQNSKSTNLTENDMAAIMGILQNPATDQQTAMEMNKLLNAYKSLLAIQYAYDGNGEESLKNAFDAACYALDPKNEQSVTAGISTMADTLSSSLKKNNIKSQLTALKTGLSQLSSGYTDFDKGLATYFSGVNQIADGYDSFDKGLHDYNDGLGKTAEGADELAGGMNQMNDGIKDMPQQVQDSIDQMIEKYSSNDFKAVSFTDKRNKNIKSVQFIVSTDAIKAPEKEPAVKKEKKKNFWDRLVDLFTR